MRLTATMTAIRLRDRSLLLHSPIAMTKELHEAVQRLGRVAHLFAPNTFHHTWIAEWAAAFPAARVHGPAALGDKRPDLSLDRTFTENEPAFGDTFDEVPIHGFRLEEAAIVHRPSRTLIVADLVHNIGRPEHWWTKWYAGAMGFYDRVAISRAIRWTAFSNPAAARASLNRLCSIDFTRIVVGHGTPIETDAKAELENAYRWL